MKLDSSRSLFVLFGLLAACGGSTPPADAPPTEGDPAKEPPAAAATPKRAGNGTPQVSQELGEIDPKEVDRAWQKVEVTSCHSSAVKRVEYLSGDFKTFIRLDASGKVKQAYFEETSLGDREFEKCILQSIARAPWPTPKGGEAEIHKGMGFGIGDAREPTKWPGDKVEAAVAKTQAATCTEGTKGSFVVTAYVKPEGKDGRFEAIGVQPPSFAAESKVDCIVDALKSAKLPSPGSYAAKVTFKL